MKSRFFLMFVILTLLLAGTFGSSTAAGLRETAPVDPEQPQAPTQIYLPVIARNEGTGNGDDANLKVNLSGPETILAGETLTYTITVTNQGPAEAKNAKAVDTLPSGVTFKSADASQGSFNSSTGVWTIGNLAKSSSVTLSLAVTVNAGATGSLANQVSVSSDTNDKDQSDNNASLNTTVFTKADLRVSVSAAATIAAGENLAYTVTVTNDGPSNASGVVAANILAAKVTYQSSTASTGSYNSGTDQWSVGSLAAGSSAQLTLVVKVSSDATGNLTHQVSVTGSVVDEDLTDNSASANTTVTAKADLKVTQAGPTTILAGEVLTFTVTVTNLGPSDTGNVVVTETLPAAGVTFKSATATKGTYNNTTKLWTVGTLSAGEIVDMQLALNVSSEAIGALSNQATVSGSATDPDSSNNTSSASSVVTSFVSDDFNYFPNVDESIWQLKAPNWCDLCDFDANGSHAVIEVPGGEAHKVWTGTVNNAPRMMQDIHNEDFEVELKFDSLPLGTYAAQGFLAEQDIDDFIRFEIYSYGPLMHIYVATIEAGSMVTKFDLNIGLAASEQFYMRVKRTGNQWKYTYSWNGTDWIDAVTFDYTLNLTKVGIFAANSAETDEDETTTPDFIAYVDYFFNQLGRIDPEDKIHPTFIMSDDFSGSGLQSFWTYVDPRPDSPSPLSFNGTNAVIDVPGGASHSVWNGDVNGAPRLMQNVNNRSFEIETKFDSMPSGTYSAQGLIVNDNEPNHLQFYFYSFGTDVYIYAASVVEGETTLLKEQSLIGIVTQPPMYLRINRNGDWWVFSYSINGTDWTMFKSFHHTLVVRKLGVFIGNASHESVPPPAFTGSIDYFFNTATPIVPQD